MTGVGRGSVVSVPATTVSSWCTFANSNAPLIACEMAIWSPLTF
jgi:hypothetical protein